MVAKALFVEIFGKFIIVLEICSFLSLECPQRQHRRQQMIVIPSANRPTIITDIKRLK